MNKTEEDKIKLEEAIKAFFTKEGWATKKANHQHYSKADWISRVPKSHTKIEWKVRLAWGRNRILRFYAYLKYKTANGGWKRASPLGSIVKTLSNKASITDEDFIKLLMEQAKTFLAPVKVSKNTLPKPLKVGETPAFSYDTFLKSFKSNNLIGSFKVECVVGLEDNGTISTGKIYAPGEKIWFKCFLNSRSRGSWNVITDGDDLHVLRVKKRKRAKPGAPIKKNVFIVDGDPPLSFGFTKSDKELIHAAIEMFFSEKEDNVEK